MAAEVVVGWGLWGRKGSLLALAVAAAESAVRDQALLTAVVVVAAVAVKAATVGCDRRSG
jgi:hypothetical protein